MTPPPAITLSGLEKVYPARGRSPAKHALHSVDLEIPSGARFGLLGPNGAGKSTIINIMAGLVIKTAGGVTIWGTDIDKDPRLARASIGVVPQELNIDPFFTPLALLDLQAGMYGVPKSRRRSMEILDRLGLADKANAYARTLSGGMRRRLMVAKAMVHNPPILVLDEPTAGVDIELRRQLWAFVRELNQAGTTILLTTHYLEEAEEMCDRIAIIAQGRVVACDTTEALLARLDNKELTLTLAAPILALPDALLPFGPTVTAQNRLTFRYRRSEAPVSSILAAVAASGLTILDVSTDEADLEDIFLQLTSAA